MFLFSFVDISEIFSSSSASGKSISLFDFFNISVNYYSYWVAIQSIFSDLILSGVIGAFFLFFIVVGC